MAFEKYSLETEENLVTSVLALRDEQQQQHPMPKAENICSSQYQYFKENLLIKLLHMISEMRKITLQIRLFMIFMFRLMLWKTLHTIITR